MRIQNLPRLKSGIQGLVKYWMLGFSLVCKSLLLLFWLLGSPLFAEQARGIWVECEGSNETLSSPQKINKLIQTAKDSGINTIFFQVYRHNRSWYNSKLADSTPFKIIWSNYKIDPLAYAISEAHKHGMKVHAWINVFRIGKDLDTPVIKKLGRDVITRDGYGVSLTKYPSSKLPDDGYWLDPGDLNVQGYLLEIVNEILQKYPNVDGIHLDFIRYPHTELNPGSQFSDHKDFGYGKISVSRFESKYGYSPLKMDLTNRDLTLKWDNWRRVQISGFVSRVYNLTKKINPKIEVSCAVQPWTDRAYLVAYQDWHYWLNNNLVDFIVTMNYSIDRRLVKDLSEIAVSVHSKLPAYIGLGAYLLIDKPYTLYMQIKDCQDLGAKGIFLFSYDAMLKNKNIFKEISKNKWWTR